MITRLQQRLDAGEGDPKELQKMIDHYKELAQHSSELYAHMDSRKRVSRERPSPSRQRATDATGPGEPKRSGRWCRQGQVRGVALQERGRELGEAVRPNFLQRGPQVRERLCSSGEVGGLTATTNAPEPDHLNRQSPAPADAGDSDRPSQPLRRTGNPTVIPRDSTKEAGAASGANRSSLLRAYSRLWYAVETPTTVKRLDQLRGQIYDIQSTIDLESANDRKKNDPRGYANQWFAVDKMRECDRHIAPIMQMS